MQHLILMQGHSGSGKTTKALKIKEYLENQGSTVFVVSADNFFMVHGEYVFDASRLGVAHARCQNECKHLLSKGYSVIVDNCNTRQWEADPYIQMGIDRDVDVIDVVFCNGNYQNTHNVPESYVDIQKTRMEPLVF